MKLNIVPKLTAEDVQGKMTWQQIFRYYWPNISDNKIDFLLYEQTCYPFDPAKALEQVYGMYKSQIEDFKIPQKQTRSDEFGNLY